MLLWVPGCYIASAVGEALFALIFITRIPIRQTLAAPTTHLVRNLLEGIRFIFNKRLILLTITLDLFAVLLGGAVYLLPIYADEILGVGELGYALLFGAPAAGSFLMAIYLAYAPPMQHAGRNLLLAVAGFGVATIVFGFSTSFYLSLAMLFLTGLFDNVSVVIRHTLVQMLTPDEMRGRVSAVNGVFIGASNELGGLESGLVARWVGPVASVVSGGIGTLIVVGSMALGSKRLRRLGTLEDASRTPGGAGG
jgi:MFS family permease